MGWRRLAGLVVLFSVFSSFSIGPAVAAEPAGKPLDLAYVTDDFFAAVVIHPARLLKSPLADALPLSPWPEWLKERTGAQLDQIEQAIVMLPRPGKGIIYQAGGVIRFREAVVNRAFLTKLVKPLAAGELTQATHAGKTYWVAPGSRDMAAHAPDAKTLVFANEDCLKAMLDGTGPRTGIVERLRSVSEEDDFVVVAEMEPVRRLLGDLQTYVRGDSAVPVILASEIAARLKLATVRVRLTGEPRLHADFEAPDAKAAELLEDFLRGVRSVLKVTTGAMPALIKARYDTELLERRRLGLLHAAFADTVASLKVTRQGSRVVAEAQAPKTFLKLVAALIAATQESASANNLRQVAIAMHLFHDVNLALPASGSYSKEGKPLLSLRVHILPYVEQQQLYREFHLDEPWDSPHNKKLIARMPAVFGSPGRVLEPGKTCYLLPVGGDETYRPLFDEKPKRMEKGTPFGNSFGSVTDGLSNTVMIVEAAPGSAVVWTRPDDWKFDANAPTTGLFGTRKGKALFARADASAGPLPKSVDDETLRRMVGRNDGRDFKFPPLSDDDE